MCLEFAKSNKCLLAKDTGKWFNFFPRMRPFMLFEVFRHNETHVTKRTGIWFHSTMNNFMFLQLIRIEKSFLTKATVKILSSDCSHVVLDLMMMRITFYKIYSQKVSLLCESFHVFSCLLIGQTFCRKSYRKKISLQCGLSGVA